MLRESSTILVLVVDREERILFTNFTLPRVCQIPFEEFLDRSVQEFIQFHLPGGVGRGSVAEVEEASEFRVKVATPSFPVFFRCRLFKSPVVSIICGEPEGDLNDRLVEAFADAVATIGHQLDYNHIERPLGAELDRLKKLLDVEGVLERMRELSMREREVFDLLARGLSSKSIAKELSISHRTVGNHRACILSKIKANGAADLTRMAVLGTIFCELEDGENIGSPEKDE